MAWPSGPMVEGISGLRKLAKERSEVEAGVQNSSSSDFSGCGVLLRVKPCSGGEAAPRLRDFLGDGFSGGDFLLGPGCRSLGMAEVRKAPSAACFGRDLLLPVNSRSAAAAVAGWRAFLLEGFSGEGLLLPCEGRRFFAAVAGPPDDGVRVGFFLLTDKGSPRKKKEKSQLSSLEPERM
ncbi:MAG: hypothetical protein A2512_11900 [Deltaproteobacteria bacterium RIFOXYD12_FULL_56_24]|nr:MAG: hypothetical protein A2512_11900 [Deltaproteobacteria bacterium RIFOXYD12_FULL_56_24]